jgi:hypothetical protein
MNLIKSAHSKAAKFLTILFTGMSRFEVVLFAACIIVYVAVILHCLDGRYSPTNRFNVLIIGLVFVAMFVGFCKSFSARIWNGIFFAGNVLLWIIGIAMTDSSPWYVAVLKTFTQ